MTEITQPVPWVSVSDESQIDGRKLRYSGRRAELLDAASVYVLEHGIASLSMRPLAKAIGIAPSAVVHHFGTKEELVTEVLGYIRDRSMVPAEGATSDLELYRAFWYRWAEDDYLPVVRLAYEVIGLAVRSPERFGTFRAHATLDWVPIIAAQLRAAGCPAGETDPLATSMVAHISGLQLDLLLTGDRERLDAAHELFVEMVADRRRSWVPVVV